MPYLADLIKEHRGKIRQRLHLNSGRWCRLPERLAKCEKEDVCADEQLWTFLAACGYAIGGAEGVKKLTKTLTGSDLCQPDCAKIWMEVTPFPPRKGEPNTYLDLALGTIAKRGESGIGLGDQSPSCSWICFCEMKWYGDIATRTKYDIHRNQLARVIENALYFNDSSDVYVALVTPKAFKNNDVKSRLYQYKFEEYNKTDRNCLKKDLDKCILPKRKYPDNIADRVDKLKLRWPTYDCIFNSIPDSEISEELEKFWRKCGRSQ